MKLFIISYNLVAGGAEVQMRNLLKGLTHSQNITELHVVYTQDLPSQEYFTDFKNSNIKFHKIDATSNYSPRISIDLLNLIKHYKPDIIQSWCYQFDILLAFIKMFFKDVKFVSRESNSGVVHNGVRHRILRPLALKFSEIVVCNSPTAEDYWLNKGYSTCLINNGYNVDENTILDKNVSAQRRRLIENTGRKKIISVCRLVPQKNVDLLIRSFLGLVDEGHSNIELEIVGDGSEMEGLRKLIPPEQESLVNFVGHVERDEVERILNTADLYCLLSDFEGAPNAVFEAILNCVPVIISDIYSNRQIFPEAHVVFSKRDESELATNISMKLNALSSTNSYQELEDARQWASKFNVQSMTDNYIKLYENILHA